MRSHDMTTPHHTKVLHIALSVQSTVGHMYSARAHIWCCRAAAAVRAIFVDFDARFEAGSLDEAYLDVTDYCKQHGLTGRCYATESIRSFWHAKGPCTVMRQEGCEAGEGLSERPHSCRKN